MLPASLNRSNLARRSGGIGTSEPSTSEISTSTWLAVTRTSAPAHTRTDNDSDVRPMRFTESCISTVSPILLGTLKSQSMCAVGKPRRSLETKSA